MLRSIFILMLVAFMASVGFYYENQVDGGLIASESGIDHGLVAATAIGQAAVPVPSPPDQIEIIGSNTSSVNTVAELKRLGVTVPFGTSVYPAFCVLDSRVMVDD
jgi:hypothetical protein